LFDGVENKVDEKMERSGLVVVFATLDGDAIPKGHFGEAPQFDFYRLTADSATRVGSMINPRTGELQGHPPHADSGGHKGGGIGRLLGTHGAQVMVSRAFGPNIKRMRQRFLPVKLNLENVDDAISQLQANWPLVAGGRAQTPGFPLGAVSLDTPFRETAVVSGRRQGRITGRPDSILRFLLQPAKLNGYCDLCK